MAEQFPIDEQQAQAFRLAFGKNGDARLRAFSPWKGSGRKSPFCLDTVQKWQQSGLGVYIVINHGGDDDDSIHSCAALFCEWDDRPIEWQVGAWKELRLPEPSLQVDSGGKSIHNYWIFDQPAPVETWCSLQERLIAHTKSDPKLKNASRVMRLPGTWHFSKGDSHPAVVLDRQVSVIHDSGHRYTLQQLDAAIPLLPSPPKPAPLLPQSPDSLSLHELLPKEQFDLFSSGVTEGGRNDAAYKLARNLLAIQQECSHIGSYSLGFSVQGSAEHSLSIFNSRCSPPLSEAELSTVLSSASQSNPEPDPGLPNRLDYHRRRLNPSSSTSSKNPPPIDENGELLTPIDQWDQLLQSLVNPSHPNFERNTVRRQIRAATAARELQVAASPQQVRASLQQHQRNLISGTTDKGTKGGQKAKFKPKEYLIDNLISMRCLTGIAAYNKVGKTKVATELVSSLIFQHPFMGNPEWLPATPPDGGHKFILWWVDQPGADTESYLKARGLMDIDGVLHPQIVSLFTADDDLSWDDQGIDLLIRETSANPGAILITDSFFACIQRIHGSDQEPEAGGSLIDIQTLLSQSETTHVCLFHSPKETGPVGIHAIRGHGSAGGAVSGVLSLHFLEKKDPATGKWVADKDNPHRRMVYEGRGPFIDLLIKGDWAQGTFNVLGNFNQALSELTADQRKADNLESLTEGQRETLEWVGAAIGLWKSNSVTAHQVAACKLQGSNRAPTRSEIEQVRKQLIACTRAGLLSQDKDGRSPTWRYRNDKP